MSRLRYSSWPLNMTETKVSPVILCDTYKCWRRKYTVMWYPTSLIIIWMYSIICIILSDVTSLFRVHHILAERWVFKSSNLYARKWRDNTICQPSSRFNEDFICRPVVTFRSVSLEFMPMTSRIHRWHVMAGFCGNSPKRRSKQCNEE